MTSQGREPPTHTHIIQAPETTTITVDTDGGASRWFRLWSAIVDSGLWAKLSSPAKAVIVVIAKHCDRQWIAWPSVARIGRLAGVSRSQVFHGLRDLEESGLLERRSGGGKRSNLYLVVEPPVSWLRPVALVRPHPSHGLHPTRLMGDTRTRSRTRSDNNSAAAIDLLIKAGVKKRSARCFAAMADYNTGLIEIAIRNADHLASEGKLKNRTGYIRKAITDGYELHPALVTMDTCEKRRRKASELAERDRIAREAEDRAVIESRKEVAATLSAMDPFDLQNVVEKAIENMPEFLRSIVGDNRDPFSSEVLRAAVWDIVSERDSVA